MSLPAQKIEPEEEGDLRTCAYCKEGFVYIKGVSSVRLQHHCSMPCLREHNEERGDDL